MFERGDQKLWLLNRIPEAAIDFAVRTMLNLRESWESASKEERKDLVNVILQEVGVDVAAKRVLQVKARPGYVPLFSILDGLHLDNEWRYWKEHREAEGNICDMEVDSGQMSTGVEILLTMSHNT